MRNAFLAGPAAALLLLGASAVTGAAPGDVKAGIDRWVKGDPGGAVALWRPLAEAGDADAQFNMGQAYKLGKGVAADPAQAQSWYMKAARQGHQQAQVNIGLLLYNGGHRQEALPWIRKAVEIGNPYARYVLGTELFNGDLTAKDWPRAYALMLLAADGGVAPAADNLKAMEQFIPIEQRRQGVALAQQMGGGASARAAATPVRVASAAPASVKPAPRSLAAALRAAPVPARATAAPVRAATPLAVGGRWRVQLGAFGNAGGAQRAWAGLKGKVAPLRPLQPQYVAAGAVTRLQAGPLPDRASADRVCAAAKGAGSACFPVAP
ncbi:MAG: SPOR domain-containing protein [Allosphingosinicella sp.]